MSSIGNLAGGSPDLATYLQQQKQGPADKLFAKIDTDGDGKISKSELETAFTAAGGTAQQADVIFAKLDKDGDGSVTKTEFVTAARQAHHHGGHAKAADSDAGASATKEPQGTSEVQNADGSTTTTITTADGTTITITTPAPDNDSSTAGGSNQAGGPKISLTA